MRALFHLMRQRSHLHDDDRQTAIFVLLGKLATHRPISLLQERMRRCRMRYNGRFDNRQKRQANDRNCTHADGSGCGALIGSERASGRPSVLLPEGERPLRKRGARLALPHRKSFHVRATHSSWTHVSQPATKRSCVAESSHSSHPRRSTGSRSRSQSATSSGRGSHALFRPDGSLAGRRLIVSNANEPLARSPAGKLALSPLAPSQRQIRKTCSMLRLKRAVGPGEWKDGWLAGSRARAPPNHCRHRVRT